MKYESFELFLAFEGEKASVLRVLARSSTHGEAKAQIPNPWYPPSLEQIRSQPRDHKELVDLGTRLYRTVFVDKIEDLWHLAYGSVSTESESGLRLRFVTEDSKTASWPWELIHFPGLHTFPGTLVKTPLTRYLPLQQTLRSVSCPFKVSALAVVPALSGLNMREENLALSGLEGRSGGRISVDFVPPPVTLKAVRESLQKKDYQILHFTGHGTVIDRESVIFLDGADGLPKPVSAAAFAHLVGSVSIRAVILNSCQGAKMIELPALEGTAVELLRHGTPAVVGIQASLRQSVANTFARELYASLADARYGGQIETAVTHARSALFQEAPHHPNFALPVLFLRAPDGRLWWPTAASAVESGEEILSTVAAKRQPVRSPDLEASHLLTGTAFEQETLRRLQTTFRGGRGIIILGEEVGRSSEIPTTGEIAAELRRRVGVPSNDLETLQAAYARQHGERELRRLLLSLLDDWNHPLGVLHLLVARMPVPAVITTGVDRLLEEACRRIRQPYSVFVTPADVAYGRPDWLTVLKLRGTLDHPRSLRIGDRQVVGVETTPGFVKGIENLLQADRQAVAIGLHPEDPCFDLLTRYLLRDEDMPPPVSFHTRPEEAERCRAAGWTSIVYEDGHGESAEGRIVLTLGELADLPARAVPRKPLKIERRRNPFRRLEAYRKEDEHLFIGRSLDCVRVLDALERFHALLLFGDSGVGKTSFLQAALTPEFERRYGSGQVRMETVSTDLVERWPDLLPSEDNCPALLILDQFERFFDPPEATSPDRNKFLTQTIPKFQESRSDLRLLFSLRRDRLADLHPFKSRHPGLYHDSVELDGLGEETAREVLTTHFAAADYLLPKEVTEKVVERTILAGISYLPALQLYGHAVFEAVESARLDDGSVAETFRQWARAGSRDALGKFVQECLTIFAGGDLHSTLVQVLRQLTLYSRRQQLRRSSLPDLFPDVEAARAVLGMLEDKRMIRFVPEREAYELVHDALVEVIETGPLALEAVYSRSDLRVFLLDPKRRVRLSETQLLGLLRFCLRHGFPCTPWLRGLENSGTDSVKTLLEMSRDPDPQVSIAAFNRISELDDMERVDEDATFRRHLSSTIHEAFYENEPLEKGFAAGRILGKLGWREPELQPILDFVDPYRHMEADGILPEVRATTAGDRKLVRFLLPGLLDSMTNSDLLCFGAERSLVQDDELGEEGMAEVMVEAGRRGLWQETLRRLKIFSIDGSLDDDPEGDTYYVRPWVLLHVLARLPPSLPPVEELQEMRCFIAGSFGLTPNEDWAKDIATLLRQIALRDPEEAMSKWLGIFPAVHHSEPIWSELSPVGRDLVQKEKSLELILLRLESTHYMRERWRLMEVVLQAHPGQIFSFLETFSLSEYEAELTAGLYPNLTRELRLYGGQVPRADDVKERLEALSPLALWREARDLAQREDLTLYRRWQGVLHLSAWSLAKAAWQTELEECWRKPAQGLRPDSPSNVNRLYKSLREWNENYIGDVLMPSYKAFQESLVKAFGALDRRELHDQNADTETLEYWLSILRVYTPDPKMALKLWPPIECTPAQFPVIENILREAGEIEMEMPVAKIFRELEKAFHTWMETERHSPTSLLEVHLWLNNLAAELAFRDGHDRYKSWFKALSHTTEDRNNGAIPHTRSRQRWGLHRRWPEPPWWIMCLESEVGIPDEDDLGWLYEDFRDVRPEQLCPNVRRVVTAVARSYFLVVSQEDRLGEMFEKFCRGPWAEELARGIEPEDLLEILEYPVDAVARAGLKIWSESDHAELLPEVVELTLGRSGALRTAAVTALDRWFARL